MWIVRRSDGEVEMYEKMSNFESWTRIDLYALFYNLDRDERGWAFMKWLEYEVLNEFPNLKTAESCERWHPEVIKIATGEQVKSVIWPPTAKAKTIPLSKHLPDDSLEDFEFWCYDPKIRDDTQQGKTPVETKFFELLGTTYHPYRYF
ncbi:hypothetical protein Hanom_Chr02g00127211 [Helianthus anomalus]